MSVACMTRKADLQLDADGRHMAGCVCSMPSVCVWCLCSPSSLLSAAVGPAAALWMVGGGFTGTRTKEQRHTHNNNETREQLSNQRHKHTPAERICVCSLTVDSTCVWMCTCALFVLSCAILSMPGGHGGRVVNLTQPTKELGWRNVPDQTNNNNRKQHTTHPCGVRETGVPLFYMSPILVCMVLCCLFLSQWSFVFRSVGDHCEQTNTNRQTRQTYKQHTQRTHATTRNRHRGHTHTHIIVLASTRS